MGKLGQFIEIGRVVVINYGELSGKTCVVLDIVDQARALVDGPFSITGVRRQTIPLRNLSLTKIKLDIPRAVRPSTLEKAFIKAKVSDQWNATSWAKKAARVALRSNLSDFDRFKVMISKKKKNVAIAKEVSKLRKASLGGGKGKGKPAAKPAAKGKAK